MSLRFTATAKPKCESGVKSLRLNTARKTLSKQPGYGQLCPSPGSR